ncbi:MAG TPA: glycosyltransferase family A protein [Candidatus Acidoferrales bacterium]|nr:glycosyltransferase family A protein [Candidatus Acidoferrales bacterium]
MRRLQNLALKVIMDRLNTPRYIVISPAKDESERIEKTIQSVVAQTVVPLRWIIVDDGSRDGTAEIVQRYAQKFNWIQLHRIDRDAERRLGSAEILAFAAGFELVKHLQFDFIVKLDCDLELPASYFDSLIAKFECDERLGIASGQYCEETEKGWIHVAAPPYHAAGASKMVRMQCYKDIGGFPMRPGWDTADEIKAQYRGWRTRRFVEIPFRHLRKRGAAMGAMHMNRLEGKAYYGCGGGILFLGLKVAHRMATGNPPILGGLALLFSYLKALIAAQERLVNAAEARFYRDVLNQRIWSILRRNGQEHDKGSEGMIAI